MFLQVIYVLHKNLNLFAPKEYCLKHVVCYWPFKAHFYACPKSLRAFQGMLMLRNKWERYFEINLPSIYFNLAMHEVTKVQIAPKLAYSSFVKAYQMYVISESYLSVFKKYITYYCNFISALIMSTYIYIYINGNWMWRYFRE